MKKLIILTSLLLVGLTTNNKVRKEVSLQEIVIKERRIWTVKNLPDSVIEHIKYHEKYMPEPYRLGEDKSLYIGYGHQILPGERYEYITEEKATELLKKDLIKNINSMIVVYKNKNPQLSSNQLLALGMLGYNCGPYKILKWSLHDSIMSNGDCSIWVRYCCFNGKPHKKIRQRRIFELSIYNKE